MTDRAQTIREALHLLGVFRRADALAALAALEAEHDRAVDDRDNLEYALNIVRAELDRKTEALWYFAGEALAELRKAVEGE